ncbi:prepilin peptidase [Actinomyces viscosus]|nr:prepilin peptidase [Actinomyces viscosus]
MVAVMSAMAAVSVALIAGPVSTWTRSYVRRPAADDPTTPSNDADGEEPQARPAPRALKHPGLLESRPQALVALAVCCWPVWWGLRANAIGPTVVALPAYALLGCAASADSVAHLLPNRILGSVTAWLLTCGAVVAIWRPETIHAAGRALLLAAAAGGISLTLALIGTGMGMGDVKLCAVIGLWLGWHSPWALAYGFITGILIAGIVAFALLITGRVTRKDSIAYGPYLIAGAFLVWPAAIA